MSATLVSGVDSDSRSDGSGVSASGVAGGLMSFGCQFGESLVNGQCVSSGLSRSVGSADSWWSEWLGDWWIIPVLVVLVVLGERLYSLCRRHMSSRSGAVDSSEFSALQQSEAGEGADEDEDDVELHYGMSESDAEDTAHKHNKHPQEHGQQQQQQQQTNGTASR